MLSQKEFVEGCYNWYREVDLQPGNPEDGQWDEAHYPVPKCKDGTETILLLREHHAVQGVIQSEEMQWKCIWGWEEKYLEGEYLELFNKWMSEGVKLIWANKTEEEKILFVEKTRAREARKTEEEKILIAKKISESLKVAHARNYPEGKKSRYELHSAKMTEYHAQLTEEEKIRRSEKLKATLAGMTEEEKILKAEKCRANSIAQHARRREREAQELLARWKEGVVRECIL